jgi:hypothetical protein
MQMRDKGVFNPEKIIWVNFKMIKAQVEASENFDFGTVVGHELDNSMRLSFDLNNKLAKVDFFLRVTTRSNGGNEEEANGNFQLTFIYLVENLEELATPQESNRLDLDPRLANALSSVTYSTARGILLTRLQGTALQDFVLPIINPATLLQNK